MHVLFGSIYIRVCVFYADIFDVFSRIMASRWLSMSTCDKTIEHHSASFEAAMRITPEHLMLLMIAAN